MIITTLVLLSLAQAVASTQPSNESRAARAAVPISGRVEQPRPDAGPFAKLFIPSKDTEARTAAERHAREQLQETEKRAPKIVCGMTVIPTDPQIDPKMIRRHADSTATFHIKRIPAPACVE